MLKLNLYKYAHIVIAIATALLVAMTTLTVEANEPQQKLTMQTVFGEGHIVANLAKEFAREVSVYSNGRIEVTVRFGAPFGDPYELTGQVARGLREIDTIVASSEIDPRLTFGFMGGLVSTYEQAELVYGPDGPFMQLINEIGEDAGFKYIAWAPTGFGGIAFRGDGPESLPSSDSSKVRVAPFKSMQERYRALGFNPVPMAYSETYSALQTGVIDGKGATPPQEAFQDFGDVTKTYVYSRDYFESLVGIGVSMKWFKGLSDEDKAAVLKAGYGATRMAWAMGEATETNFLNKLGEKGIKVVKFSDDEYRKINELTQKSEWPIIKEEVGEEIMTRLQKMAK